MTLYTVGVADHIVHIHYVYGFVEKEQYVQK